VRPEVVVIVVRSRQDFRLGRNARSYGSPQTAKFGESLPPRWHRRDA
jgi:hypothetical protein